MKKELFEWVKALVIAVIAAAVIRYFIFAPVLVDGQSMMTTLHDQDRLIVSKINYTIGEPERFDIVVFHVGEDTDYIKRIIGLPGDTVEYKNDTLYINGKAYDEPYLKENKGLITDPPLTEDFAIETLLQAKKVPADSYFVMGDNRRNSKDSRHIGFIKKDKLVGKAVLQFWPFKDMHIIHK